VPLGHAARLRHTFATPSLHGADSSQVKALLGHQTIRSTQVYVDMAQVQRALLAARFTPADNLMLPQRGRSRM
jgi:site-specific recombinase XerD